MPGLALLCAVALAVNRPMEMLFVRHGETQANATGHYNPRTIDTFSDRGEREVAILTKQLSAMHFDAIVVSPSPRALRTIAPYLRAHHLTAQVWPELLECCDSHSKTIPGLTSPQILYGRMVGIPRDLAQLFVLEPWDNRYIVAESYDDGLRQIRLAAEHLKRAFGGTGKRVLVVGHSLHGGRMLEILEGKEMVGKVRPDNCKIMPFIEQSNGLFVPATATAK